MGFEEVPWIQFAPLKLKALGVSGSDREYQKGGLTDQAHFRAQLIGVPVDP
jgi:hypothetical protein